MTRTRQAPYVLAVDPGGTTGFATWDSGFGLRVNEAKPMKFLDLAESWTGWAARMGEPEAPLIVVERYVITPGAKSAQYDALEQIGALRWIAHRYGAEFALQGAADAKRIASNAVLKDLGWYTVGMDHGRDATRHLVLRLIKDGRLSLVPPE